MTVMKRILFGLSCLAGLAIIWFVVLFAIEIRNHEDFQPYSNHRYKTSILLDCNVFDVSAVLSELYIYLPEYNKESDPLHPIYAEYRMMNRQEGTAMYAFSYSDETGRGVAIEFEIDLLAKCVVSVRYQMGYNKRIPSYSSQGFDFDGLNLQSEFDKLSDQCMDREITSVLFILANDEVELLLEVQ